MNHTQQSLVVFISKLCPVILWYPPIISDKTAIHRPFVTEESGSKLVRTFPNDHRQVP